MMMLDSTTVFWLYEFAGLCLFFAMGQIKRSALESGKDWLITAAYAWGAFLHELTHFIVGLLTAANPSFPSVLAYKAGVDGQGREVWVAGSVICRNLNPLNRLFIGLAPLLLWPLAAVVAVAWYGWVGHSFMLVIAKYVLMQLLLENGWPSRVDFQVALKDNLVGVLIAVGVSGAVVYTVNRLFGQ